MERGFYNDDIEQLIRQKADQYKMFPSENVWKGIYRSLHTRRKWYGLGLLLFLGGISYLASLQLMTPATPAKKINNHAPAGKTGNTSNNNTVVSTIPDGPVAVAARQQGSGSNTSFSAFSPRQMALPPAPQDESLGSEPELPHAVVITRLPGETIVDELYITSPKKPIRAGKIPETAFTVFPGQTAQPIIAEVLPEQSATATTVNEPKLPDATKASTRLSPEEEDKKKVNWLQEYAVYELTPPAMRRLSWQLSFSPTMNYRKLSSTNSVNDQLNIKGLPAGAIEGKPETLVNHRPALGFEVGGRLVYALSPNVRVSAGIQFNYSRYDIQAYTTPVSEKGKIQLDVAGPKDSLVSYTNLRNFSGDKAKDLQNQYFQLSAPIGVEVNVLGNERLQLNVAGSLQPTYLLNRNSYLITTDFKNYMRAPSLVRRWNFNAGAEIFVSYKTGDFKLQAGPQFRYQLLSSYVKEYPIREYLMEYGIKIGVTKTLR